MRKIAVLAPVLAVAAALIAAPADAKPGKGKGNAFGKGHTWSKVDRNGPPYGVAWGYDKRSRHARTSRGTSIIIRNWW